MRKLARSVLPAITVPLLLAGCQGVPPAPYVAPTDSNTARLLFRAKTAPGMAYSVYTYEDAHTCGKPMLIGSGNSSKQLPSSTLRAGPLATLRLFAADKSRRSCQVLVSFYPARQRTYIFATTQDTSGCAVRVIDATDGENLRGVKMFRRTLQRGACAPLDTTRGTDESSEGMEGAERQGPAVPSGGSLDDLKGLLPGN